MKNVADKEIGDLTRNIQAAQARMNNICTAIGRAYYADRKDNPEPAYVQMFNDMEATEKQIEQMQTRIKFLNGIVVCTNCKADNSVNSAFCAACGSRLPHTFTADGSNRCTRCGNIINPGQLFCGSCGQKVEAAPQPVPAPVTAAAPEPAPVAEAVPQAEPVIATPPQLEPIPVPMPEPIPVPQPEPIPVPEPAVEFAAAAEPVPEAVTVPALEYEQPQSEGVMCCPNCKTPIKAADALFCAECGTRLR